jgi:hypothetical protein
VKRLLWLPTLVFSVALAACGGSGGSSVTPPPPTGGFTQSSLKGNYAFSMSGMDPGTGAYFVRTGSFVADGAGNITSGLEDALVLGSVPSLVSLTGRYDVLPNGRGTIILTDTSGNTLQWTMELQSNSVGLLVETDGNFASSGSFNLQNVNDFAATSISGSYVFDISGINLAGTNVTNISIIGNIVANGGGTITAGVIDTNDANNGPSGATTLTPGSYQLDASNGTTFGRGTATFAGRDFAFYIVDATHIKLIEEDASGLEGTSGDGVLQTGTIPTTTAGFTGSFVYLVGGSSTLGPDAAVARFTANAGAISAISYDENNDGTMGGDIHISQGSNISNATYAIDNANAGSGRGTFTFTDSTGGTFQYVFYLYSPNSGVIQDVSGGGFVSDGTLLGQSGSPFTLSGLAGSYVYNWNGVNVSSFNEEDFIGQFALASGSTNNISGVLDGTVVGASAGNLYPKIGTQGTLTIATDSTTNNTLQIVAGSPLSTTFNSVAYIVDANTILVLATDKTQVLAGIVSRQSQ